MVPLPLWLQSASPTGAKEAEEHERKWRSTQGDAPPSASLALGYDDSALPGRLPLCGMECQRRAWLRLMVSSDGAS